MHAWLHLIFICTGTRVFGNETYLESKVDFRACNCMRIRANEGRKEGKEEQCRSYRLNDCSVCGGGGGQHGQGRRRTPTHPHSTLHNPTQPAPLTSVTSAQHSTAQHSTAQHSTAQHSTAQHSTAQHSTYLVHDDWSVFSTCMTPSPPTTYRLCRLHAIHQYMHACMYV